MPLLEELYQQGIRRFYNGAARGFDLLAAECVLRLQTDHPDVRLILAIPCREQERGWHQNDVIRYQRVCYCADECRLLTDRYFPGCMQARDRYMVDRAAVCLCFMREAVGGTGYTVKYALRQELKILNLAMEVC